MAEANVQVAKENTETVALAAKSNKKERPELDKDQCRYCKEKGHWLRDCPNLKTPYDPNRMKKKDQKDQNSDTQNNNDKSKKEELAFVTAHATDNLSREDIWVADSGCTHHMSPYEHLFSDLKRHDKGIDVIYTAESNQSMQVAGVGTISTEIGKLLNVLYVPSLGQNLFSISSSAANGLTHVGKRDKLTFFKGERELFFANLTNKMYLLRLTPTKVVYAKANIATLDEWHARFAHVSEETLKIMSKKKVVHDFDVGESKEKCLDCQLNKCTRAQHQERSTAKAPEAGNVLHIDTAGPSNVPSRVNSKYMVLCKDEYSGYRQVAFLEQKTQVAKSVKTFVSRTLLDTGNSVLKIVTDNGSEYVNNDLKQFFEEKGIIHERSVPYTPSQNGYIERDIRTVKEAARTMLNHTDVNKNLWTEAIANAVYTLNRVISRNKEQTPYELWFKKRPSLKNLRIFGESAVIKTLDSKTEQWDEKGSVAKFLGYTDRFNTFRFLDHNDKIIITCDAVFLNQMYKREDNTSSLEKEAFSTDMSVLDEASEEELEFQDTQSVRVEEAAPN